MFVPQDKIQIVEAKIALTPEMEGNFIKFGKKYVEDEIDRKLFENLIQEMIDKDILTFTNVSNNGMSERKVSVKTIKN